MLFGKRQMQVHTIADYDAYTSSSAEDEQYELVDGDIVMMANPTETHEQIAGNIGAPLKMAMDGRGCRTYQGGIRVQRSDATNEVDKTRPDVVVRCGPMSKRTYITDPVVIVDVLSPSTIDYDRGAKLEFHKSLPTVQHIALVYQDQMRVEHYRRTDAGFVFDVLTRPDAALTLAAIDFDLPLANIYFGVEL
jgi:Uma2 family endonuclease